jgi:Ca2+-binding EF-hand superfamily protein
MKSSRERHPFALILALIPWIAGVGLLPAVAQMPFGPPLNLPPLAERKAAVLKSFDKDGDGRLSPSERDAAREAWYQSMLSKREERGFFRPPQELMDEFDVNKDGELDDEEGATMGETLGRRFEKLNKDYDKNTNGRLDEDEIDAASKDIDDGKLKGIPKMFLQMARGGPRGGRPGGRGGPPGRAPDLMETDPADLVRSADRDGDGRLNEAELETARAAWAKRRAAKSKAPEGQ